MNLFCGFFLISLTLKPISCSFGSQSCDSWIYEICMWLFLNKRAFIGHLLVVLRCVCVEDYLVRSSPKHEGTVGPKLWFEESWLVKCDLRGWNKEKLYIIILLPSSSFTAVAVVATGMVCAHEWQRRWTMRQLLNFSSGLHLVQLWAFSSSCWMYVKHADEPLD